MAKKADFNMDKQRSSLGQLALERQFVVADSIFELETERVFGNQWIYGCHQSEIDESSGCFRLNACGTQLILLRSESGDVKAFHNFCRHRGSELVTEQNCGSLGQRIQCPYHAWTYDRQGALVSAPNMTGQAGFDKAEYGLKQVECASWHGLIFVRLVDESHRDLPQLSLSQFMAPLEEHAVDWSFGDLKVTNSIDYEVSANWKLIFQNYSECYHCPTVHPALNRLTPFKGASNDVDDGPILGGPMRLSEESETMSSDGKSVGSIFPNLDEQQKRAVAYYTVFPSFFLSAHPDYVLIHRLERVSVSSTKVSCQFLFHPDSIAQADFDPSAAVEFWDLTNRQDWEVCELAQRGITDVKYEPGPYSNLESVVAAFDRHYRNQLGH
ncbi:MAG: aromatic ring-hydroxylating dioxygenase subunit alpha [Mariniblastus sp.]|nr:aromatic ring-hydroxylating dioxygenase subunit alpha [Mariniblastus sp.]